MSLRGIKPLSPGSSDFPFRDYNAAAKAFIDYACKMPKGSKIHPLNSKNPQSNSLYSSQRRSQNVFFLGGPWNDYGPSNPGPRTHNVQIPEDVPILCCAVLSIISREEFPHRFNKKAPARDLLKEAADIIAGAKARIKITDRRSNSVRVFNKNQLTRVSSQNTSRINVSPGVWPALRNGQVVNGCWDSYFLALPGFQKGDEYTIEINARSRMFDARRDGPLQFKVDVKTELDVV
jgi:hypothetical protein